MTFVAAMILSLALQDQDRIQELIRKLGSDDFTTREQAQAAHLSFEVLHRVASMASGGMDTLPHNGAVITLLAVSGLTHKTSYRDIFAITCLKTVAVFFVIGVHYATGLI